MQKHTLTSIFSLMKLKKKSSLIERQENVQNAVHSPVKYLHKNCLLSLEWSINGQ